MLTYPCMEESCVCTVPASRSIVPLRYVQCWSQLSSYQKKNKKEKQAPTVNSSILLTLSQMNKWLFTGWKNFEAVWKIWRRNGMQKEVGKGKKNSSVSNCPRKRGGRVCNIYLPLQRNNSGNNPCNWFNPRGQIKLISIPRIITTFPNLAQLRL